MKPRLTHSTSEPLANARLLRPSMAAAQVAESSLSKCPPVMSMSAEPPTSQEPV